MSRVKGHKEDTILQWLREAAQHAGQVDDILMAEFQVQRGQLDALWAYVGNKGEKNYPETETSGQFWRSTMIDMDSRLRVAHGISKDETQASTEVFRILQQRGYPDQPPPTSSDGWCGIDNAMVDVYGCVPEYRGIGRPPTRKKTGAGWKYLQMVKQRDEYGRFQGTKLRVIFGFKKEVVDCWEKARLTSNAVNSRTGYSTVDRFENAGFLKRYSGVSGFGHLGRWLLQSDPPS